jgi:hypothetical protein
MAAAVVMKNEAAAYQASPEPTLGELTIASAGGGPLAMSTISRMPTAGLSPTLVSPSSRSEARA